jgi:hypothetical protein
MPGCKDPSSLLQVSPFASDCGQLIGRNPCDIPPEDWLGNPLLVGLKAIRAKCIDCAFDAKEVRKCVVTDCALWPLRMGAVPRGLNLARQGRFSSGSDIAEATRPGRCEAKDLAFPGAENDVEGVK